MKPKRTDVRQMVEALNAILEGTRRARKHGDAALLSLLQQVAVAGTALPSTLAGELNVHQSTITRQARALGEKGFVAITGNPADGRSCHITLTPAGRKELARLTEFGLSRYELFVTDWSAEEVRSLGRLLHKLGQSIMTRGAKPTASAGPAWRRPA